MPLDQAVALVAFVCICLAAGALGGIFTSRAVKDWFPSLTKPRWNPPSWLFAPVWTLLYITMGLATWMIWRDEKLFSTAGYWFAGQLILNIAWSWLFFHLRRPDLAFYEIVLLCMSVFATVLLYWQANHVAGLLLIPYLVWVAFAAYLNYTIWQLNQPSPVTQNPG